jgi:hypothetical protein
MAGEPPGGEPPAEVARAGRSILYDLVLRGKYRIDR